MRITMMFLLVFGIFNPELSAQIIHLDKNSSLHNIGRQVTYFEDKDASLGLDQVKEREKDGRFLPGTNEILNFGNNQSAFWVKVSYTGSGGYQDYLIVDVPNIDEIDCYIPVDTGTVHLVAGAVKRTAPGVTTTNNYTFSLPGPSEHGVVKTLWLRVKTNNILLLPIKMVSTGNFIAPGNGLRHSLENIYIGLLLTLVIFNLFLYFSVKDRAYLYYCLYVFTFGIYVAGYLRGYGYLLGENVRIALNYYPHIFVSIALASSIQFCKSFFNLKTLSKGFFLACNILLGACMIILLISLLGYKSQAALYTQVVSLITPFVLLFSGFKSYRSGNNLAGYYIWAWTAISITVIAVVVSMQGIFTFHDYIFEYLPLGSAVELLLLAFALGDRYRIILDNERKIREENFLLIQTQNQRLEKLVEARTISLKDTIVMLEESNTVKNKLFSIIAHDLRSPFHSLISIFSLEDMDLFSFDELKLLLTENRKNIETIYNTLNNLLYWARSQMEKIITQPANFNLNTLISDLILVYTPLIQKKNIHIHQQFPPGVPLVYADENQIQLVLRNLIDNAIKFTPAAQDIEIILKPGASNIRICINNPVSNPGEFDIKKITNDDPIATYGTGHEKGIGLGLHLCREYIKSNGGKLDVSMNGRIVSFSFELPVAVNG